MNVEVIDPKIKVYLPMSSSLIMKHIERCGRICYQSQPKGESAEEFIRMIIKRGHESVLEHIAFTVVLTCDRGVTHEIVRHRIASYSQESTRYVPYKKGMRVVRQPGLSDEDLIKATTDAYKSYSRLLKEGHTAQIARTALPNALASQIAVTMNLREWRHFFRLRCSKAAHPAMRAIAVPLFHKVRDLLPAIFDSIDVTYDVPYFPVKVNVVPNLKANH